MDGLLESVVKFSNYITARLIVAGTVFYVLAGFLHLGNPTDGLLPNLELVQSIIENYQAIFDILGVSDFALLLIFFLFLTTIHITYLAFDRIGHYIPPAIIALPGWEAIEDLTHGAFNILREARGVEHSDAENQRLFEFRRKLEKIDEANEAAYRDELANTNAAFRISKSMMVFAVLAWLFAAIRSDYQGDATLLLIIFLFALAVFVITMVAITRAHYERIDELRTEVTHQFLGFTSIWAPAEYQQRMVEACVPTGVLKPTSFKVLMPVYGTLDVFLKDMRRIGDAALVPSSAFMPVQAAPAPTQTHQNPLPANDTSSAADSLEQPAPKPRKSRKKRK